MSIHISRVYTRGGDKGETSLVGGARIAKDARKLEAFGTVDELISAVGLARTAVEKNWDGLSEAERLPLDGILRQVQNELFDTGSILATPAGETYSGMPVIAQQQVDELERRMDELQQGLPALDSFVLPGGAWSNAFLHQCRVVCRRAEREIVRLSREEEVPAPILKYLNRLSDLFFVLARHCSRVSGAREYLWETPLRGRGGGEQ